MTLPARRIHAVLFDLDGTLVDNMEYHVQAWIELGAALGHTLTREQIVRDFAGRKNSDILTKLLGRELDPRELAELAEQKEARYRALYAPRMAAVAGAHAFLEALAARGIACGVATAAPLANRDLVLNGLGLATRMQTIVGVEAVSRAKPAPDLFLEAARRLAHAPEHTLVFEDAVLGVQAGRAAGMTVCGVTTSEPSEMLLDAGAIISVRDFTEIPPAVQAWFTRAG